MALGPWTFRWFRLTSIGLLLLGGGCLEMCAWRESYDNIERSIYISLHHSNYYSIEHCTSTTTNAARTKKACVARRGKKANEFA